MRYDDIPMSCLQNPAREWVATTIGLTEACGIIFSAGTFDSPPRTAAWIWGTSLRDVYPEKPGSMQERRRLEKMVDVTAR
ncbi:MAG: hypothetical protein WCY70_08435 [Methanoculleus sp.]